MIKRDLNAADQPLRETEEAAYHAFREWPLLLVIRQQELAAHQRTALPELLGIPTPSETKEE